MTPRDKKLLDMAASNATALEMEAEVGIPAAQCVVHVKKLLAERDIWTEIERRQLLLHDLYELKDELLSKSNMMDPRAAGVTLQAIRLLSETLDKQTALSNEEVSRITNAQTKRMLEIIGEGFKYMEQAFPELEADKLRNEFARGIEIATS